MCHSDLEEEALLDSPDSEADYIVQDTDDNDDDVESVDAPPFSPLTEVDSMQENSAELGNLNHNYNVIADTINITFFLDISQATTLQSDNPPVHSQVHVNNWYGFKIVGDSIDKNVRASYHRMRLLVYQMVFTSTHVT